MVVSGGFTDVPPIRIVGTLYVVGAHKKRATRTTWKNALSKKEITSIYVRGDSGDYCRKTNGFGMVSNSLHLLRYEFSRTLFSFGPGYYVHALVHSQFRMYVLFVRLFFNRQEGDDPPNASPRTCQQPDQ